MERIKKDKTGPMRLQTPEMLKRREKDVLKVWMEKQLASITLRLDLISKEDLERQTRGFLTVFIKAISGGNLENIETPEYKPIIKMLEDISKNRADQGFSCSETATYVFSLQDTILQFLQEEYIDRPEIINQEIVLLSKLITKLGLVTIESFIKSREKIIEKQSDLMIELSIPVMILAQDILMIPIVGVVDSNRAQLMMELVLKKILETEAKILIIDVLGVPYVDSGVATHILKITKAVKLMGCKCVISGISPAVAQTMVHLGIELGEVISTSTVNNALLFSYQMLGVEVVKMKETTKKR